MAPPWSRTLAPLPSKLSQFATNSLPRGLSLNVPTRTICILSCTQQSDIGSFGFGVFIGLPTKLTTASSSSVGKRVLSAGSSPYNLLNPVILKGAAYSTTPLTSEEVKKEMGVISEKFGEALELLNDARSSAGTVYFSEDMKDAEIMVEDTLSHYKGLLSKLEADARLNVQRTIGLKMEELKAQFQMIKESIRD